MSEPELTVKGNGIGTPRGTFTPSLVFDAYPSTAETTTTVEGEKNIPVEVEAPANDATADEKKDDNDDKSAEDTAKEEEERKIKYKDYPYRNIKEPHENDVLFGRGGE